MHKQLEERHLIELAGEQVDKLLETLQKAECGPQLAFIAYLLTMVQEEVHSALGKTETNLMNGEPEIV